MVWTYRSHAWTVKGVRGCGLAGSKNMNLNPIRRAQDFRKSVSRPQAEGLCHRMTPHAAKGPLWPRKDPPLLPKGPWHHQNRGPETFKWFQTPPNSLSTPPKDLRHAIEGPERPVADQGGNPAMPQSPGRGVIMSFGPPKALKRLLFFSQIEFESIQKNSGLNPWSFQFWRYPRLGPRTKLPSTKTAGWIRQCGQRQMTQPSCCQQPHDAARGPLHAPKASLAPLQKEGPYLVGRKHGLVSVLDVCFFPRFLQTSKTPCLAMNERARKR